MRLDDTLAAVEAILFVTGDPVSMEDLAHSLNLTGQELDELLDGLEKDYQAENRGIRLNRSGGQAYLSIDPARARQVEAFLQPLKKQALSQAVLETLSVIAYRQPATRGEIEAVRGVKCDYSVQMLLKRGLIEEAGQRDTLGHPVEYRTTDQFLVHFGIRSLDQLPDINELSTPPGDALPQGPFEKRNSGGNAK